MQNRKVYYKDGKNEFNKNVHYYVEINFEGKKVWWCFHPVAPKEIHWKKADEMGGLGVNHHTDTQSFEEFIEKPKLEISSEKHKEVVLYIKQYLAQIQ